MRIKEKITTAIVLRIFAKMATRRKLNQLLAKREKKHALKKVSRCEAFFKLLLCMRTYCLDVFPNGLTC